MDPAKEIPILCAVDRSLEPQTARGRIFFRVAPLPLNANGNGNSKFACYTLAGRNAHGFVTGVAGIRELRVVIGMHCAAVTSNTRENVYLGFSERRIRTLDRYEVDARLRAAEWFYADGRPVRHLVNPCRIASRNTPILTIFESFTHLRSFEGSFVC